MRIESRFSFARRSATNPCTIRQICVVTLSGFLEETLATLLMSNSSWSERDCGNRAEHARRENLREHSQHSSACKWTVFLRFPKISKGRRGSSQGEICKRPRHRGRRR